MTGVPVIIAEVSNLITEISCNRERAMGIAWEFVPRAKIFRRTDWVKLQRCKLRESQLDAKCDMSETALARAEGAA